MALETQLIDVKFDQGIDTRSDGFLRTGNFDEMVNVERQKSGGIIKRNGFDQIPQTGLSGAVLKICEISGVLCAITDEGAYKYNGTSWNYIGAMPSRTILGTSRPYPKDEIPVYVYNNGVSDYIITKKGTTYVFRKLNSDFLSADPLILTGFTSSGRIYFLETSSKRLIVIYNPYQGGIINQYFGDVLEDQQFVDIGGGGKFISACVYDNTIYVTGVTQVVITNCGLRQKSFIVNPALPMTANGDYFEDSGTSNIDSFDDGCGSCADGTRFFLALAQKTGGGYITPSNIGGGTRITFSSSVQFTIYINTNLVYTGTNNSVDITSGATTEFNLITYVNGTPVHTTTTTAWGNYLRHDIKVGCSIGSALLYDDRTTAPNTISANPVAYISSSVDTNGVYKILRSNFNLSSPTWFTSSITFANFYKNDLAISNITTNQFDLFISNNPMNECTRYSFNKSNNLDYVTSLVFSNCIATGERLGNESIFIDTISMTSFIKNLITSKVMLVFGQGSSSFKDDYDNYSPPSYSSAAIVSRVSVSGPDIFNVVRQEKISNYNIQILQLYDKVAIACGVLCYVTTTEVCEFGFFQTPTLITKTYTASGGSLAAGSYQYAVTYSYITSNGELEESNPVFHTITCAINSKNYFKISTPTETLKTASNCYVNIYRTNANESILNLIWTSKITSVYFEYTDYGLATTFSAENLPIYTTGGIFNNSAIGACFSVCATKNRLFIASSEDKTKIFYSKEKLTGYGFEFSGLQYIDCNGGQFEGEITAMAGLDEKIIIAKDKYLLGIYGDGPNAAGGGSDFSIPQSISTDVGVSDKNSMVITPEGIMFKSKKGIYLINRGLQVTYDGVLVDQYSQDTVYSAMMSSNKNLIYFGLSNQILVYDYLLKNWFRWTGKTGIIDSVSSTIINDVPHFLTSGGRILKQNAIYTDQLTLVPTYENIITEIETSWLEVGSISGFQRMRRVMFLGHGWGAASYDIKFMRDYNLTVLETHTLSVTETAGSKMQVNMHLTNQKGSTTKVNIKESGIGTANKTSLSGMSYELGLKKGTAKVPFTRKI